MQVKLFCDGGNIGRNPSPDGVYWSVGREHESGHVELLTARGTSGTHHTNNEAEYLALQDALSHAHRLVVGAEGAIDRVVIHSDSQLIVNQFNGRWGINDGQLARMAAHAQESAAFLAEVGVAVEVVWVRREENVKRLGH